jgi:hypothetical protein
MSLAEVAGIRVVIGRLVDSPGCLPREHWDLRHRSVVAAHGIPSEVVVAPRQ